MTSPLSRIRGSVHDIDQIKSLSGDDCNVVFLTSKALYVLGNLANEDVTYTSRYGRILSDGMFERVDTDNDADYAAYVDVVYQIQGGLMAVNCFDEGFALVASAIDRLTQAQLARTCGCEYVGQGADNESGTEGGPAPSDIGDIVYTAPEPIANRKCKASYWLYDNLLAIITEWDNNSIDSFVTVSLTTTVATMFGLVALAATTAFVATFVAVVGAAFALGLALLAGGIDLEAIKTALVAKKDDLICALHNATTADGAKAAFLDVLDVYGLSALNQNFISLLMLNSVFNVLFFDNSAGTSDEIENWATPGGCYACDPCALVWDDWAGNGGFGSGDLTPDGTERVLTSSGLVGGFYWLYITAPMVGCTNEYDIEIVSASYTQPDGAGFAIWFRVIPDSEAILIEAADYLPPDDQGPIPAGTYQGYKMLAIADVPFTYTVRITAI